MKKQLVKLLLENSAAIKKINSIFELNQLMNRKLLRLPELKWTVVKYRRFLQNEIINQIKRFNCQINFNAILSKVDAILQVSICDYRPENCEDYRLVASEILENSRVEWAKKLVGLEFFKKFRNNSINKIIRDNEKILLATPLTNFELNDLNKRIIFGFFGGLENIENMELVKYKFNKDYTSYEENNKDYTENGFLKINVKDENKILQNKYLKENWDEQLRYYYDYLKNGLLTYQIDSIITTHDPQKYAQIKNKIFQNEKLQNNYLISINYSWANEDKINEIINEWKIEILSCDTKSKIEDQFWKEKIEPLIKKFKQEIIKIVEIEDLRSKLKNHFNEIVEATISQIDGNYTISAQLLEDIFNIVYHKYVEMQESISYDDFNITIDSDSSSDDSFSNKSDGYSDSNSDNNFDEIYSPNLDNEPSTSTGIYKKDK